MARTTISLGMSDEMLSAIDHAIAVRRRAQPFQTLTRMAFIRGAIEREITQAGEPVQYSEIQNRRREAYESDTGVTERAERSAA